VDSVHVAIAIAFFFAVAAVLRPAHGN